MCEELNIIINYQLINYYHYQLIIIIIIKFSSILIILTGMSPSWMTFEIFSTLISVRTSSLETKLKERFPQFLYSDAISRILGWFLHLAVVFRVGSSTFSAKESQFSQFGILRFFTAFAKKLFSSFAASSQFVNKELRYFNFEPNFKLRWCRTRDLFCITNSSNHRTVWTADILLTK